MNVPSDPTAQGGDTGSEDHAIGRRMSAQRLAEQGFAILRVPGPTEGGRCSCQKGADCAAPGKHPEGDGWQKRATRRPAAIDQLLRLPSFNSGIFPQAGSGLMVVDVDVMDSIGLLGAIPSTFIVKTSKGVHIYLRLPEGVEEESIPKILTIGEVRRAGSGHVVGPWSIHASGAIYTPNGVGSIAIATPEFLAALRSLEKGKHRADHGEDNGASPSFVTEAIAAGELRIPVGGRDIDLARVAGSIARAYTEGGNLGGTHKALELIAISGAVEQPREDPITALDIRRIARSIVGIEERRAANNASHGIPTTDRQRRGGDWILDAPESIESLWGTGGRSLWPVGEPLILVAPPGVGKTTLIQQVVLHGIGMRRGTFLGHDVRLPDGLIGYIAADRPTQIQRSMRRMVSEADRELLNTRLSVWRGGLPFALDDERIGRAQLAEFATERGWSVVIIDSLKDVCSSLNDDASGIRINNQLQEVVARGIEVCVSHHQRKATDLNKAPRRLDDVYGSRWLTAGAGSVLMLWGEAGDEVVDLTHLKQPGENVGPLKLRHDHARGVTVVDGLAETRLTTARDRNERAAREMRANGASDGDIARELAVTARSVRRYLADDPTIGQAADSGRTENGTRPDSGPADNPPVPRRGVVAPSVLSLTSLIRSSSTDGGSDG